MLQIGIQFNSVADAHQFPINYPFVTVQSSVDKLLCIDVPIDKISDLCAILLQEYDLIMFTVYTEPSK